ncbi:MAG: metal-dependent transcriptional regulator [Anaerolineae bacterium]|nr:metal-dependent transcriptional regulator [Anaerolineae bacterium]
MQQERVEEYLGAIYRLRTDPETPLPLSQLTEYFGFSSVSVHEMVQKLDAKGWVVYHPYRGVTLTASGEEAAGLLLRRHRLWERFLTDVLEIPWDVAHVVAGRLEHAATETVTERLSTFLGDPKSCPHGAPIPPQARSDTEQCLSFLPESTQARVVRISPETPALLQRLEAADLFPGRHITVRKRLEDGVELMVQEVNRVVCLASDDACALWVEAV